MKKVGRNEPCPCGSGKKYKNCHQKEEAAKSGRNKTFWFTVLFIAIVIIAGVGVYLNNQTPASKRPPGPPPPGQVWSEEHGHYH